MNFRQLKAFDTVMRLGSITGAAKALHVSQPSVTRLVRELETHLGFALFLRRGRGIAATVEARRFHQAVESAFMNIERLDDLAATIRKTAVGKVSVGVIPTFSFSLLPEVLGRLRQEKDDTHTIVYIHNTPAIVDAVRLQQFDIGIVSRSPPYLGVHSLYQTEVNYVALVPQNHSLAASKDRLDLREVAGREEFITFGKKCRAWKKIWPRSFKTRHAIAWRMCWPQRRLCVRLVCRRWWIHFQPACRLAQVAWWSDQSNKS